MNLKKIVILHYCYGNKNLCLFEDNLKRFMKNNYPDDTIIENRIIKRNVSVGHDKQQVSR